MLTIRKKYSILQVIQLVFLFLMSLNFANLYFYMIFCAFFVSILANARAFRADVNAILLAALSLCYVLFYPPTRESYTTILKQFSYPMCYLIGLNLFRGESVENQDNNNVDQHIKLSIWIAASGTFLHYVLNAFANMGSELRNTQDYWTGEVVSATGQALIAVIALSVFGLWLVGDYPVRIKVFALVGLAMIFAYNFVLAGRTNIILEAIIILVAYIFTQRHMGSRGRIKSHIFIALVILAAVILFINNAWGIRDWMLNSNLSNRFSQMEFMEDLRFERKIMYFARMLDYPFGGGQLRTYIGGYAHEIYLDAYSDVGILGYGLLIAIAVISMISVIKLIKSEALAVETRALILCVFLGINIVFILEPILQGEPWLFCIFCFLSGITTSKWKWLKNR